MEHKNAILGLAAMRATTVCRWAMKIARVLALISMIIIVLIGDDYRPLTSRDYFLGGVIVVGALVFVGIARSIHLRWYQVYRIYECERGTKLGVGLFIGGAVLAAIVISGLFTVFSSIAMEQRAAATLAEAAPNVVIGAGITTVLAPPEPPIYAALRSEIAAMIGQIWFMACASFAIAQLAVGVLEVTLVELPFDRHRKIKLLEERGYYVAGLEEDY